MTDALVGDERNALENMVLTNLEHFHLWNDIQKEKKTLNWRKSQLKLLSGLPPHPLSNDNHDSDADSNENILREYILPVNMTQYKEEFITLECLDLIFDKLCPAKVKRIILAIVNTDGTTVFYFVYKGIHKPKKN